MNIFKILNILIKSELKAILKILFFKIKTVSNFANKFTKNLKLKWKIFIYINLKIFLHNYFVIEDKNVKNIKQKYSPLKIMENKNSITNRKDEDYKMNP